MPNIGPLLTDSQLHEWRNRIHKEWLGVVIATRRAAKREARLRRYLHRHYRFIGASNAKGNGKQVGE